MTLYGFVLGLAVITSLTVICAGWRRVLLLFVWAGGPSMSQEMASTSFRIVELEAEVAYFSSTISELNRICSSPVTDDGLVRLHMGEVLAAAAGGCR